MPTEPRTPEPGVHPTPQQWVWMFEDADPARRLEIARAVLDRAEQAMECFVQDHAGAVAELAHRRLAVRLGLAEQWTFPGSTLVRVVDGDTFDARVGRITESDFGFHIKDRQERYAVQRFRLNRAAAAPGKTPSGQLAARTLRELLEEWPFILTSVKPYKFGDEWMAEVSLSDGSNLTDTMIALQLAMPWNGNGTQPVPPWPRTI